VSVFELRDSPLYFCALGNLSLLAADTCCICKCICAVCISHSHTKPIVCRLWDLVQHLSTQAQVYIIYVSCTPRSI